ncbi:hypothetical protein Adt_11496 [Abeliophyllum distichum]|uniref:Uncharacterized protein n=1 Tax=Abeliophyllum distichum TaxID=126358 RepID=A0ABD1UN35_9LAMI
MMLILLQISNASCFRKGIVGFRAGMEREQWIGDRDSNSSKKITVGMRECRRLGAREGGTFGRGEIAGAVSQCLREEKSQQWAGDRESNSSEKVAVDLREHRCLGAREGGAFGKGEIAGRRRRV